MTSRRRHTAALATLLTTGGLAVASPAARADDASLKASTIAGLTTLGTAEQSVVTAVRKVDRSGRSAVPAARVKVRTVRTRARRLLLATAAQQASTPQGASARRALLSGLRKEDGAYAKLDDALVALRHGQMSTARTLLASATRRLDQARQEGVRIGRLFAALPDAPTTTTQ